MRSSSSERPLTTSMVIRGIGFSAFFRLGLALWRVGSEELGEPVDDGACRSDGRVAVAGASSQVHTVRVPGGGRGLPQAAGQVVDGGVAGRGGRVVPVGEPVAQR